MRDRDEAIEAAMLYVIQPSDKEHAKWSALLPVAFVRALKQDGYTVERTATIAALRAALEDAQRAVRQYVAWGSISDANVRAALATAKETRGSA